MMAAARVETSAAVAGRVGEGGATAVVASVGRRRRGWWGRGGAGGGGGEDGAPHQTNDIQLQSPGATQHEPPLHEFDARSVRTAWSHRRWRTGNAGRAVVVRFASVVEGRLWNTGLPLFGRLATG